MQDKIFGGGQLTFTIEASDKLSVYSETECKVYSSVASANFPVSYAVLKVVPAKTRYTTSAFSSATSLIISAGAEPVYYDVGTAPVVFTQKGYQGAPGALNATGALTVALITSGIVTSAAAATTGTLPTGAVMDASLDMDIDECFDWSVIKVGANAFTVAAAASGHTIVGLAATAATSIGMYRTRKTAAATYVTYRIG